MRAAVIERFGPSSELRVRELPTAEPGPAQVLIEVHDAHERSQTLRARGKIVPRIHANAR